MRINVWQTTVRGNTYASNIEKYVRMQVILKMTME